MSDYELPSMRLTRDLREAARTLSDDEARYLVTTYYQMQDQRIRTAGQVRTLSADEKPCAVVDWFKDRNAGLEGQVKAALDKYSAAHPIGAWARSIVGIGPVIAAGLIAHIDITKAPTVGHIWSFAGLVDGQEWKKGEKRPWNAELKTLCWKLGESFVKVQQHPRDYYGQVYKSRKAFETARNERGEYADQAAKKLERFKIGKDTEAYGWYSGATGGMPMLPPAHIHARAKRYAVKLFLSHLHDVWYRHEYGTAPPYPYPIAHMEHAHYLPPPNAA